MCNSNYFISGYFAVGGYEEGNANKPANQTRAAE